MAAARDGRNGRGCLIFWSSGNGNELLTYDAFASHPSVLAIGAVDAGSRRAYYSDYGPYLFAVTPSDGVEPYSIVTTDIRGDSGAASSMNAEDPDYSEVYGGTSAAAAMASGVAALVMAAYPELTAAQVAEAMARSAYPIDTAHGRYVDGHSHAYGHGRLDPAGALDIAALYTGECTDGLELCGNERDDDCNGITDDPDRCTRCVPTRDGGEVCDLLDNDCDGELNEGFVCIETDRPPCAPCLMTYQCEIDALCRASPHFPGNFCFRECLSLGSEPCPEGFECDGEVCVLAAPSSAEDPIDCEEYVRCAVPEACDGVDSDCDGVVDDVDPTGREAQAAVAACRGDGLGVCAASTAVCRDGAWVCVPPAGWAEEEICCDGVDNDCDGEVDDGCPALQLGGGGGCGGGGGDPCDANAARAAGGAGPGWIPFTIAAGAAIRRRRRRSSLLLPKVFARRDDF